MTIERAMLAQRPITRWAVLMLVVAGLGCGGVGDQGTLPPNVPDPATLQTAEAAVKRYYAALSRLDRILDLVATRGGLLTDELQGLPAPLGLSGTFTALDERRDPSSAADEPYQSLHWMRGQAREARGFLAAYAPDSSPALRAHMFALEGYADILLADLFCSGIPLSTVDFGADYTIAAGSTTSEVYAHAAALLDSAGGLASDSARITSLAAVGRGRALLALGHYTDAAAAVAGVPDGYMYQVDVLPELKFDPQSGTYTPFGWASFLATYQQLAGIPTIADREGSNGLDYVSSGDPRINPVPQAGTGLYGGTFYWPDPVRFGPVGGTIHYTLASAIEARLIEAEAALQAGGDWLARLNALRTDGTYDTQPNASDPSQTDTLWHAGTGGVAGLQPLADPVDPAARVDLLFHERAFWLYQSGHRQGDLRRLIRQYRRAPSSVYPIGPYPGGDGSYGDKILMRVPDKERELNPRYSGCFNENA